jgi:hypothetical protein
MDIHCGCAYARAVRFALALCVFFGTWLLIGAGIVLIEGGSHPERLIVLGGLLLAPALVWGREYL